MAQIQKLIQENQKLKYQLEKFKSSNGLLPYIDDSAIKGGYHVVKNISERDSIDCCHRKLGMKVLVIGSDLSFKEYILKTDNCKENIWKEVDVTIEENEVFLIEDYSELSENLTTQKELNLILKQLILNLQTALDEKQDILTENNVGQFMELELSTKSTPTSGDTVLGKDSLTGKAVEIPTSSLVEIVDVSNLVPYTGANKDVNIASHYFKTSKGFDYTYNLENFFRTYHSGDYNADEFKSSHPDMGTMVKFANVEEGQQYDFNGNVYSTQYGITSGFFRINIFNKITNTTNSLIIDENGFTTNQPIYSQGGFVLYEGTENQALTADGGAFDLDSKADLVDGKIKQEQSQPSTMVMNNSTYVITFTDATGAVQTIDLPLESLFQDANYDETTKSLIITLQDGTIRTIPLSDLVDLPEIVLATTNPGVTPTSGQKVYFNTSLGKVWFNVAGVWTYSGNLITDAEKIKLAKTSGTNTGDETGASIITKLGFTPENVNNKSDSYTASSSTTYTSTKALVDGLSTKLSKGTYTGTASDLVPYNGALQDVNIASNYFKTSKGFDFTFDAYNYFNTYHNDYYSTLEFKSKDSSDDNFGYLQITANAEEGFNVDCVDGNGATANSLQVNINGISSPKAFVSGVGFKTPFGTPNQTLTADGGVFDLNLKLSTEAPSTTGTVISFSTDKVYGTLTTPETGNITADVTNAKLGVTNIIIHNSGTAPTFGSAFKKLSGSGNYVAGVVNYIYCTFISATEIIYSINQRT